MGDFTPDRRCNRKNCCCPFGFVKVSSVQRGQLRIQAALKGLCPPKAEGFELDIFGDFVGERMFNGTGNSSVHADKFNVTMMRNGAGLWVHYRENSHCDFYLVDNMSAFTSFNIVSFFIAILYLVF
jgi:hypothetical protein